MIFRPLLVGCVLAAFSQTLQASFVMTIVGPSIGAAAGAGGLSYPLTPTYSENVGVGTYPTDYINVIQTTVNTEKTYTFGVASRFAASLGTASNYAGVGYDNPGVLSFTPSVDCTFSMTGDIAETGLSSLVISWKINSGSPVDYFATIASQTIRNSTTANYSAALTPVTGTLQAGHPYLLHMAASSTVAPTDSNGKATGDTATSGTVNFSFIATPTPEPSAILASAASVLMLGRRCRRCRPNRA